MVKVSIVIVNYRVKHFLEQSLRSVRAALKAFPMEAEVFVVDNHSQDDSLDYLTPRFPEVRFIANTENVGFARANNQAIELATGQYILLLNPDTVIAENTLFEVCQFMDAHPDAGGAGVKMIDGNGRFLPESKRGFPTPWVSFCKIFGLAALFPHSRLFGRYHLKYLSPDQCHPIDILSGAFMFMRRETLDKSGLLDESFFMYGEDIDLSYRLVLAGYANYYLPTPIIHYKGESTQKGSLRYVRIFYEAMLIFFKKHYPHYSKGYALAIKCSIFFRASLAAAYRVITAPFSRQPKPEQKEPGEWYIISNNPDDIATLMPGKKRYTALPSADRIPASNKKSGKRCVVFDTGLLSFREIIETIQRLCADGTRFLIYNPESRVIVSPKEIYTLP